MRTVRVVAALALAAAGGACARHAEPRADAPMEMGAMDSSDAPASRAAHEAMNGPLVTDPHLVLTPARRGTAADSARAGAVLATMRSALAQYADVARAEAAGFRPFLPGVQQPVYHFTNWRWALEEMFRFDPAKPTSLLYRPEAKGGVRLVGAMYTAPARASAAALDARLPLSIVRWHEHVNWCVPPRGEGERWRETRNGQPVFGPRSPIATADACAAAGGRFLPRLFGWMVHVMAFESHDPRVIWGAGHEHGHS